MNQSLNLAALITKRVAQSAGAELRENLKTIPDYESGAAQRLLRMALAEFPQFFTPKAGRCFVCHCTEHRACLGGCAWTDKDRTLCTACKFGDINHPDAPLAIKLTRKGKREAQKLLRERNQDADQNFGNPAGPTL